ncbi:hypothetical protein KBX55_14565 [Lacticaseibacillus paracasei]|nr:hypothetical protein [Lacticaseibacillus paracasei]
MTNLGTSTITKDDILLKTVGGLLTPTDGGSNAGGGAFPLKPADLPGPKAIPYYGDAYQYRIAGRNYATN